MARRRNLRPNHIPKCDEMFCAENSERKDSIGEHDVDARSALSPVELVCSTNGRRIQKTLSNAGDRSRRGARQG